MLDLSHESHSNYSQNSLMYILIKKIVFKIRNENNLSEAAIIILNNNLTFEELINSTIRLNIYDIAKLADITLKINRKE